MKLKRYILMCAIFFYAAVNAQMKIGNNSTSINDASLLELETTNQGLVFPRISLSSVSSSSPLPSDLLTGTVVYNTNSSITNGNGIGLYSWNGSAWVAVTPSISGSAWSLTGNSGTNYASDFIGTKDNIGFRIRTNNIERFLIDSIGNVGIGSSAFNTLNREKLLVDYGSTTSHTIANFRGSINDYFQINLQNQNNGLNASTDFIATADDGTDSTYYVDFGINSSNYSRAAHNWGGAHDAYLYSSSKNLLIGTASSADLFFLVNGGSVSSNTALRIKGTTGNIIIGKGENSANPTGNILRGPNANGANIAGGNLTMQGGTATGTGTGGSLNIYGGLSASGTAGAVNINNNTGSETYINTGTSTSNIYIGGNANNIILPKFGTVGGMYYTSVNTGQLSTTGSNMVWDSINNRLGIGTINPGYKLSVLSSSNPLYLSGVQATATFASDSLLTINAGVVKKAPYSSLTNLSWSLTGNSGTSASTNFIGTTDAVDFVAKTNNSEKLRITSAGNVGINTSSPGSALDVKGTLRLSGSSSGYVAFAPAAAAGSTTYTLPSSDGTAGQALTTNGSGTLSWAITAATIGTIGAGATIQGTATGKYYCTGSYITLPPGKFIVNVYMMLSSTTNPMTQTIANQPGSFFIKSFFADASLGTTAGATVSPPLPQSNVSPDVVGNGKLISGSLSVGQTYNPITGFVVINNTSGANKSYYYWAGWVSLTNISSTNSLPLIGGTNYGEDNIVAYPAN